MNNEDKKPQIIKDEEIKEKIIEDVINEFLLNNPEFYEKYKKDEE